MVDEYQDINMVQETILNLFSSRWAQQSVYGRGYEASIYRFRLAEPKLFLEKYYSYGSGNKPGALR